MSATYNIPAATLWRRGRGNPSRKEQAAKQQYLTPQEEKALLDYVLRMSANGYPLPVRALRSLAFIIARQRSSTFQLPGAYDGTSKRPGKNWPQGFYARHRELKSKRLKALDWVRHEHNILHKVEHWFEIIGQELQKPDILPENIYNMDETGVLLSVLSSLKVLVNKTDLRTSCGAGVKRSLVTAIDASLQ